MRQAMASAQVVSIGCCRRFAESMRKGMVDVAWLGWIRHDARRIL
jgi:hypothetical protein